MDPHLRAPGRLIFDTLIFGNAQRDTLSRSGIYRYASELLLALGQEEAQHQWPHALVPLCPDPLMAGSADRELEALKRMRLGMPLESGRHGPQLPPRLKGLLKPFYRRVHRSSLMRGWSQRQLESCLRADQEKVTVFHTPFQSVPEAVRRHRLAHVVVTVHDMLPRIHPEFFTHETVRQFELLLSRLQPSDHVICVSESTKRDFLASQPAIPPDQVHVTPLAASPSLTPVNDPAQLETLRGQLGLRSGEQMVLSLCTLEPRKNLITLISAFEQFHQRADGSRIKLVLAGSLGWKTTALSERIRSSPIADSIVVTGHIPDHQLACLYSLADAFVYPSLYEGFGLPPLEAMQCGAPVIVGHTSSLPEVVGEAALLVNPHSSHELGHALAALLNSAHERQVRREKGLAQAARYSWPRTAARTAAVYKAIVERHG